MTSNINTFTVPVKTDNLKQPNCPEDYFIMRPHPGTYGEAILPPTLPISVSDTLDILKSAQRAAQPHEAKFGLSVVFQASDIERERYFPTILLGDINYEGWRVSVVLDTIWNSPHVLHELPQTVLDRNLRELVGYLITSAVNNSAHIYVGGGAQQQICRVLENFHSHVKRDIRHGHYAGAYIPISAPDVIQRTLLGDTIITGIKTGAYKNIRKSIKKARMTETEDSQNLRRHALDLFLASVVDTEILYYLLNLSRFTTIIRETTVGDE